MDGNEEINPLFGLGFFPASTPPAGDAAAGSFLSGAWRAVQAVGADLGDLAHVFVEFLLGRHQLPVDFVGPPSHLLAQMRWRCGIGRDMLLETGQLCIMNTVAGRGAG